MQNVPCDYDTIKQIVSNPDLASLWCRFDPKVYLKDGKPYGLIASITPLQAPNAVTYIASTTTHPSHPFTRAMLRDIMRMYHSGRICLITDDPDYHDHIRVALLRYNMRYEVVGTTLYSYNF